MLWIVRVGNRAIPLLVLLLGAATGVVVLVRPPLAVFSLPLDVVVNNTALLVGLAVVWLALLRAASTADLTADLSSAALGAAFLVSTALNLLVTTVQASQSDAAIGMSLAGPTQEPLYLHTLVRLIMALTLVGGGLAAAGFWRSRLRWWWVPLPLLLAVTGGLAIHAWWPNLPAWLSTAALDAIAARVTGGPLAGVSATAVMLQASIAVLLLAAAALYARWQPASGSPFPRYLAMALSLGAASDVYFALYPGSYTGVVGSNDVLRLAFAVVLVIGIASDMRWTARALAVAERNARQAELARAALEERARLAREIHDGLSQHLWLAKLRVSELPVAGLPTPVLSAIESVSSLLDTGLEEAQQTVAALRAGRDVTPLAETLRTLVASFTRQRGVAAEIELGDDLADVPPNVAAEVLRVVQEALSNVGRHADATRVTVRVRRDATTLRLDVRDNGVGFAPERTTNGFGLTSMQERVAGLGGVLRIESRRSAGTRVELEVPLGA